MKHVHEFYFLMVSLSLNIRASFMCNERCAKRIIICILDRSLCLLKCLMFNVDEKRIRLSDQKRNCGKFLALINSQRTDFAFILPPGNPITKR